MFQNGLTRFFLVIVVCVCAFANLPLALLAGICKCRCGSFRYALYTTCWGPGLQHAALRAHLGIPACVCVCVASPIFYYTCNHAGLTCSILIWFKFFSRPTLPSLGPLPLIFWQWLRFVHSECSVHFF